MYDINHCSVNYLHESRGHSGILFGVHYIITSAGQLLGMNCKNKNCLDVIERLANHELLDFEGIKGAFTNFNGLKITYEDPKIPGKLITVPGQIRFLFSSRNSQSVLQKILNGFKLQTNLELNTSQLSTILSSFALITLNVSQNSLESKSEIEGVIMRHCGMQAKFMKGDQIYTKTTPFGHDSFFETKNHGIISNILDETKSVMILSMPLCPGSEGGNNVQLTIGLRFDELLNELAQKNPFKFPEIAYVPLKRSLIDVPCRNKLENSVVLVDTGSNWGCGVFVTFFGNKFILTCSHVIHQAPSIEIIWANGNFSPEIIYKNENISSAYDIALLGIPSHVKIPKENFAPLAKYWLSVGTKVFCVGFPLFSSLANRSNFSPSIFDGHVTKYSTGILWTDAQVQAGQSGGPIFDAVGHLIGICVSNTRDEMNSKVFPHTNMAIPVCDIYRILERYFEVNDKRVLEELKVSDEIQRKWNLEPHPFTNSFTGDDSFAFLGWRLWSSLSDYLDSIGMSSNALIKLMEWASVTLFSGSEHSVPLEL
uniref:Peroxisomal leader peptide-processing protease n=1 Tax=Culicoides sonorensis TaxID=179676 RepID=A0A336KFL1_CULSO